MLATNFITFGRFKKKQCYTVRFFTICVTCIMLYDVLHLPQVTYCVTVRRKPKKMLLLYRCP